MNLTFSTLASPNWTLDQIIQHAIDNGIAGIDFRGIGAEIDITTLPVFTTDLPGIIKRLNGHNLEMPCLNSSITLVTHDAAKWENMLAECRRYAQLAEKTGTKYLRVFGGSIPDGMSREQAKTLAVTHLRQLVNISNPHHCKPLLETHDAWVTSSNVMQLVGTFKPEEVGVLWDLEHPWRGGELPATTTQSLGSRIEHVHIKDTIRRDGKSIPMLLGHGELPLNDCFDALKKINYTGWICLETEKRWHPEGPEPEQSIPQFAEYVRRHS